MPNPSELARVEEEQASNLAAIEARITYRQMPEAVRQELYKLLKQDADDRYAKQLAAAARRRRELNGN